MGYNSSWCSIEVNFGFYFDLSWPVIGATFVQVDKKLLPLKKIKVSPPKCNLKMPPGGCKTSKNCLGIRDPCCTYLSVPFLSLLLSLIYLFIS